MVIMFTLHCPIKNALWDICYCDWGQPSMTVTVPIPDVLEISTEFYQEFIFIIYLILFFATGGSIVA